MEGIRIVEFGHFVSAPYCAKLFADYGADVVKIEPPTGDLARQWGPFPGDQPDPEKSGLFFFSNTNKRGITLDTTMLRGREIFLALLRQSDVLIENNPPRQMRQWGLDYSSIARVNPNLVMISITPFGQSGPYSEWRGYDLNAWHFSGASARYCGRPGEAPLEQGTFMADFYGAMAAAAWGAAAVYGLTQAGGGQHIDVSCAEVVAAIFVGCGNIGGYVQDGTVENRTGVGMAYGAPATILPCKDGYVWCLALDPPGQWDGLRRVMGDPEWMHREMFSNMLLRAQNQAVMYPLIEQWTMQHTKIEIMERCQAVGCPVTAVFTVAEAAEHPHLQERQHLRSLDHPALGHLRDLGAPFVLPECPGGPRAPAPLLGQHNEDVYGSRLGMSTEEIQQLRRDGVI